jgi:Tfp pilus assembly protein PilN
MIQFNLLPDVKKEYISANRQKKLITSIAIIVSAVSLSFVFLLFLFVQVGQNKNIDDLTEDIASKTSEINETENLSSMLTVQNQLALITPLHESKPETSRVFSVITFVSPQNIKLETLDLTLEDSTIKLSGTADNAATVNLFVDNIKAAQFALSTDLETRLPVFSAVNTTINGSDEGATFDIIMNFDPQIFNNTTGLSMAIGNQELVVISEGKPTNAE